MALTITVDLPADMEREVRALSIDLNATAKEAFLVSLYRQKKLTHHGLARALGVDRFATDDVLHRHNVTEDLGTLADYQADLEILKNLRSSH